MPAAHMLVSLWELVTNRNVGSKVYVVNTVLVVLGVAVVALEYVKRLDETNMQVRRQL